MGLAAFNRMRRERQQREAQAAPSTDEKPKQAPEPVHVGGGYYDVAGERVHGKAAADQRARELAEG